MSDPSQFRIDFDRPIDLQATLDGGQAFRWRRTDDGRWEAPLGRIIVRVRYPGPTKNELEIQQFGPGPFLSTESVRTYLGLDDPVDGTLAALERNGIPADELRAAPAVRVLRQEPWETLASFVLSQNSNIRRIQRNVEDLASVGGEPIGCEGRAIRAFPTPSALADLGEAGLRQLKIGYRAPHLIATAQAIRKGDVDLAKLADRPYASARKALRTLPGVGPKVADCVLAYSLGFRESFPVDTWVEKAVRRWWPDVGSLNRERIAEWGRDRFGDNAAYAQLLLFHIERRRVDAPGRTER